MEIIRKNELQEILDLVKMMPHGKFLITGAVGSGKTFLLNIAGKMLWEQGKKIRYKTMELFPDNKKTGDYLSESSDTVYLIDGLDDIYRYKQIVKEVTKELTELTGLPSKAGNDANVAALGEAWKGAAAGAKNVILVTLGTGVGGGIIVDGKIVGGAHGAGGEIGHAAVDKANRQPKRTKEHLTV